MRRETLGNYTIRNIQLKKVVAEWSQTSTNFLDARVSAIGGKVTTDFSVKPTGSYHWV